MSGTCVCQSVSLLCAQVWCKAIFCVILLCFSSFIVINIELTMVPSRRIVAGQIFEGLEQSWPRTGRRRRRLLVCI